MILGAFVLTNALEECGILMRIAYWIIKTCGGTYNRTLYALYLVGLVLGIICFCGHYLLLISLTYGICKAMGFGKSKEGTLMMMVGGIAALNVKLFAYRRPPCPSWFHRCRPWIRAFRSPSPIRCSTISLPF